MDLVSAAILGIVQGLTEFLPISSSAHLILVSRALGLSQDNIAFDVSLHVGTAISILSYFWHDWWTLGKETLIGIATANPLGNFHRKMAWMLIIGTIPAGLAGVLFEKQVETILRSPLVTVFTLASLAVVLYLADRHGRKNRTIENFSWGDSIWIGLSQALALIPGVSRSGITISTALLRDADRASAARFSFLLSAPVIAGAGLLEGWHLLKAAGYPALAASGSVSEVAAVQWSAFGVGFLFASVTGFLCIRYFLRYLQKGGFLPFIIYRFMLAAVVLFFYLRSV